MKFLIILAILATTVAYPATIRAELSVEPAGMKIIWKSLKDEFDGFQTYNSEQGVYLTLAVKGGSKGIISFDKEKSKIVMSDGINDLKGEFGIWNKISKDGKTMRIEVSADQVPSTEASKLSLKGGLAMMVASKTETKASESREFNKGDKVELSEGFKFEIESIGKPKWGDDPLEVAFKWQRKVPELAAVRFYDAEGTLIESSSGGSSSMGMLGKYSVTKSYKLKKKAAKLKIEVDLWMDAETVTVPVDLAVGLGVAQ